MKEDSTVRANYKSRFGNEKMISFYYFSRLTLNPFPPKGAREVVAPQCVTAPSGGRMSGGQKRGCLQIQTIAISS
jgi:hypothetical protein